MESLHNYRSKKFFSGNVAKIYDTAAPIGENIKVYEDTLRGACQQQNKITVLELACGTGRYFHFLSNVEKLTGVDISRDMLQRARENLKTMPHLKPVTELILSSIEEYKPEHSFDFIYSIGTLGEYCPFNEKLLNQILSYLKPGGFFFFTLVDSESFVDKEYIWARKRLWRFVLKFFPRRIKNKIDAKSLINADWKDLFLTTRQAEHILSMSEKPIRWELSKAKDNLHVHHICKLWIKK